MIFDIDTDKIKGKVSGIYKITNLINKKVYIGQSKNLRSRVSDYIHIHERTNMVHPIAKAVKKDGTDNFKFEILIFCEPDKLSDMELYYIKKYDSTNSEKGYNMIFHTSGVSDITSKNMSKAHSGLKESANTKQKKSNVILVFTPDHHNLIIADSGKLFGDYIEKSKDLIKNGLREPSRILGYYLYYADLAKREMIYTKLMTKRCVRNLQFLTDISVLNKVMKEGVETMYRSFNVYRLSYDYIDEQSGRPILLKVSNGFDKSHSELQNNDVDLQVNEELSKYIKELFVK